MPITLLIQIVDIIIIVYIFSLILCFLTYMQWFVFGVVNAFNDKILVINNDNKTEVKTDEPDIVKIEVGRLRRQKPRKCICLQLFNYIFFAHLLECTLTD